jgi:predicted nucleotidyltransferase
MSADILTRTEVQTRLGRAESEIFRLGVRRLALFGSVGRNAARADSDVDFLVEFAPEQKTFDNFIALSDLLEDILGHPVELVTPEALSPFIGPHILAEAADVLRAA